MLLWFIEGALNLKLNALHVSKGYFGNDYYGYPLS
jgi:hypothetical protein